MARLGLLMILATLMAVPAAAQTREKKGPDASRLGPFRLGMTVAQFSAAAARGKFVKAKLQAPAERDVMGLGLMTIQPIVTESEAARPEPGKIWQVTGYVLNERIVYLAVDYVLEDRKRAEEWFKDYDAPINVQKSVQDTAWTQGGVVLWADRFGSAIHALDYEGLRRSDRVQVSNLGAIRVANEHFRRLRIRQAETALELIRQKVVQYYETPRQKDGETVCLVPPTTKATPGESACELPEKRFPLQHSSWKQDGWAKIGIDPRGMSRYYSYEITTEGEGVNARIEILAVGDLDCDGDVATLRIRMRPNPRAERGSCEMTKGTWDIINPNE